MKRSLTLILVLILAIVSSFAAWVWLRPYAWSNDPGARFQVENAQLKRDHSNYWLDLHLVGTGEKGHDMSLPIVLTTPSGRRHQPVDFTASKGENEEITELWLKFWLDEADLMEPLQLQLNEGTLVVKAAPGLPTLKGDAPNVFRTSRW